MKFTWISFIFTIFVVVVITNGYNLIDGIDGLAGGLIIASMFFGVGIFLFNNDTQMAILSFYTSWFIISISKI